MKSKILILLAPLLLNLAACGASDSDSATEIIAPVIDNAGIHGMVFAAVSVDSSIRSSRIYYYEFAAGKVKELLPSESGNPALFYADGKVFLFNRQTDAQNFRVFDPRQVATIPDAVALPTLTAGDPWDVAVIDSGKSLALASALGESLDVLNYQTGEVSEVVLPNLASKTIRPHGLLRNGAHVMVLHSATNVQGQSDDTQAVYDTQVVGGTLTFVDADQSTTTVDGQAVTGTNPSGFIDRDASGGATILGLCAQEWSDCTAGANRMSEQKVASSTPLPVASFPYYYHNQIIDGPTNGFAFAHVKDAAGEYAVAKVDVDAKSATTVHQFSSDRLWGIAYDPGSRTLFVAGQNGIKGTVEMYRDGQKISTLELDGVLYASALVPK